MALLFAPHAARAEETLDLDVLPQESIEIVDTTNESAYGGDVLIEGQLDSDRATADLLGVLETEGSLKDDSLSVTVQQSDSSGCPKTPGEYFALSDAFVADERWCDGTTWGWQMPKLSDWTAWQCYAYACDFTKYMYGVDNYEWGTYYASTSQIQTGDVVRAGGHSFVVLERNGNYLRTAEGNYGGRVRVADPGYEITSEGLLQLGANRLLAFYKGYHFDTGGATTRESAPSEPEVISLKGAKVTLKSNAYAYTGKARKPRVVSVVLGERVLVAGTDYKVTYKSNVNAGAGQVIVTGKGAYSGRVKQRFTICPKDVSELVVGKVRARTYTGKAIKPRPVVKDGTRKLVRGVDYTLSYKRNKKVGTARIIIKGKGNYSGTRTVTFKIKRA